MGKLSTKDISATITGGYVHIIMPDESSSTGFTSKRIKLEDFISAGGGTWGSITGTLSDQTDLWEILETIPAEITEITDIPTTEEDDSLVLSPDGLGGVEWRAESGGGGTWGSITGTLSDQTDLQNALNAKANLGLASYDATIGTGGDYATVYAAVVAGKRNVKLLSNVTESQSYTLGLNEVLNIYLNNNSLNFANCQINQSTNSSRTVIIGKGTVVSTQTDTARVLCSNFTEFINCFVTNSSNQAGSAICNSASHLFNNCTITLPNVNNCGLGTNNNFVGSIINCIITGGGASASWTIYENSANTGNISNVYITARGTIGLQSTLSIHDSITVNEANSTLLLTAETRANGVYSNGTVRVDANAILSNFEISAISFSNDGAIFANGIINSNTTVSKNAYNFINVAFLGTLTINANSTKIAGCKVTGASTISANAEYNHIIFSTLTGGLTDSSGKLTNIILANYGINNKVTDTYTFQNLAGSGDRFCQVNSAGLLSATLPIIEGKLTDATAISNLTNASNWDGSGAYTGTAITGTYEGQYYSDDDYYYIAYSDNVWIRLPRA